MSGTEIAECTGRLPTLSVPERWKPVWESAAVTTGKPGVEGDVKKPFGCLEGSHTAQNGEKLRQTPPKSIALKHKTHRPDTRGWQCNPPPSDYEVHRMWAIVCLSDHLLMGTSSERWIFDKSERRTPALVRLQECTSLKCAQGHIRNYKGNLLLLHTTSSVSTLQRCLNHFNSPSQKQYGPYPFPSGE